MELALKEGYQSLSLTNEYDAIKDLSGFDPSADAQQDPVEVFNILMENITDSPIRNKVNNIIYGLDDEKGVYTLLNDQQLGRNNLSEIIEDQIDKFTTVIREKKYIVIQLQRKSLDMSNPAKLTNSIMSNPIININNLNFKLKGIIVHFGTGNSGQIFKLSKIK